MENIITQAKNRLGSLSRVNGITTGEVRRISLELYKIMGDKSINTILMHCEHLLNERKWALNIIAYDWAYRVRKQYNNNTFYIFERWLKEYITGWSDCDDFCTHAFGELLSQKNELFTNILEWTKDPNYCVRRAAAVVLIYPIKQNKYEDINPFLISDSLMYDDHYLVLKGYGWMLKVLSQVERDNVINYLINNKDNMPRTAFRYALEKMDKDAKLTLMGN
ncbi:DNA alkylation repair protein [Tissierella sp.]|uniref:DNA alkylation repair protein n=1 Tax=Tissierella sp. TaxID=41274 RepID=UPI0028592402|nr:DNA alkylation repair protein [Tissierella sp.]MDR7855745.1 DNA alkylation repair protein [Tissierella sp.]